jgi:hypothetical protein
MSPLLEQALKSLHSRINVSTGLGHPLDEDAAKEMFKMLAGQGEVLQKADIENWAVSKGWNPKHAGELGELGQKIGEGKRVQIKNKGRWKPGIVDTWKSRAGGAEY